MLKITYLQICVVQTKHDINVEVFNITTRTNEAKTLVNINAIMAEENLTQTKKEWQ